MKGVVHILRRFIGATILISIFLLILNFFLLAVFIFEGMNEDDSPSIVVRNVAESLDKNENHYILSKSAQRLLDEKNAWAMLINNNGKVVWSNQLPKEIPLEYSLTEVAKFSRYYLMDYPVFTWEHPDGLVIVGYQKDSYAKYHLYYSVEWIQTLPYRLVALVVGNIALALLLSVFIGARLIKLIKPLIEGIHTLANEKPTVVESKGILGDLANSINHTSTILQKKEMALKERDEARANWIAGISHDIRTPLSMVLGYASQLEENNELENEQRKQAGIIRNQAEKMRQLVSDLNLVSMLEYEMQPLQIKAIRLSRIAREVATDFLNNGLDEKFIINLEITSEEIVVNADEKLLVRAITNLVQNSINHNPDGCEITIETFILDDQETACFIVADNGKGIRSSELTDLFELPYSSKRKRPVTNGHGLGIPMVAKIAKAHNGEFELESTYGDGIKGIIKLPLLK